MAIHPRLRRLILIGVCTVAIATAPAAVAEPSGDNSGYQPYGDGVPTVISGGPVPTMNGVPCVAGHLGTCVAFAAKPTPVKDTLDEGWSQPNDQALITRVARSDRASSPAAARPSTPSCACHRPGS